VFFSSRDIAAWDSEVSFEVICAESFTPSFRAVVTASRRVATVPAMVSSLCALRLVAERLRRSRAVRSSGIQSFIVFLVSDEAEEHQTTSRQGAGEDQRGDGNRFIGFLP